MLYEVITLLQADQIVVNVRMAPLLEKKVIIDTVAQELVNNGTIPSTFPVAVLRGGNTVNSDRWGASAPHLDS